MSETEFDYEFDYPAIIIGKTFATLDKMIGRHSLDAVDMGVAKIKDSLDDVDDADFISFRLNGIVYTALEDPSDGYRSMMRGLIVDDREMANVFPPVIVLVREKPNNDCYEYKAIEIIDEVTGKIILEIGTANTDDYYPWFLHTFAPQNMVTNQTTDHQRK